MSACLVLDIFKTLSRSSVLIYSLESYVESDDFIMHCTIQIDTCDFDPQVRFSKTSAMIKAVPVPYAYS